MYENRINLSIKPNFRSNQVQSAQIVTVGSYCYNPRDTIGLGYISNVYLGKNTSTNQSVAIKVIDTANRDDLVLQFLQSEIEILQKAKSFKCKHLLKLEDTFRKDNKLYIVTEFCEGKDLAKALRQEQIFSDKDAQTIMKQVVKTYADLYELGIVHRDLKLSNLLVKDGQIKLADFGFALSIVNCIEEFPYNAGSPYYMPPQSLKRNRFSFKSDIWALGVMAYQLVFGKLPFKEKVESLQYDALMKQTIQEKLEGTELSEAYRTFIISCMDRDMQKRATPEYVINYYWPQAEQHLPQCFTSLRTTQPQTAHLPSGSDSIPQTPRIVRQQVTDYRITEKCITFTPSSSQLRTQRPNTIHFDHSKLNFTSQIQQRKIPSTQPPPLAQSSSTPKELLRSGKSFSSINLLQSQTDRRITPVENHFKRNEAIVNCILNYCKFLFNLYISLQEDSLVPDGHLLRFEIGTKILDNYSEVDNFICGKASKFGFIAAFNKYSQTPQYSQIKQTIKGHMYFFSSKFNFNGQNSTVNPSVLTNVIKFLVTRIPSRFALTEQLCHYYNLRSLQSKTIDYFMSQSRVQVLAKGGTKGRTVTNVDCRQLQRWVSQLIF